VPIIAVIIVIGLVIQTLEPVFFTETNLRAVAIGLVTDVIIAVMMAALLISGGFDLSVGSVLALSGVVVGLLMGTVPVPFAIAGALIVGAAIGAANGVIVTRIGVNPLVTTLGMLTIVTSLTLIISSDRALSGFPSMFLVLGQGQLGPLPVSLLIMLTLVTVGELVLRFTRPGRLVFYVGSNPVAAALSGISVTRVRLVAYTLTGVFAAFAGIVSASRLGAAFPLAGNGAELRVIAACVIGGCTLAGGQGSIVGATLGVVLLAIISNGLTLLSVSIYWQGLATGTVLIAAVALDQLNRRRQALG
jgi:ribose transport system permease protein